MPILKPDKEKDANKRPRVLLIPPPDLPVPAVQGGAVETLLTHLIRENEKKGRLDLLCASVPDEAARRAAEGLQHTKMLYVARPHGHRRYWPMVFLERCVGIAAPYDPWYQKVQLSLALELPPPDVIVAEGGNLTQCSAISRMFGRKRCLAHLHGQTSGSPAMDTIYGGVLALSEFIRDDYLQNSSLDRRSAYILYNCIDTERFRPAPPPIALRTRLGFGPRDFVVLFCGRLEPDKGIHKLMEALSKLPVPNIRLLIVGSPFFGRTQQSSFLRKLEQQAKALGDRVQFTGYIPNEDLPDYYRLADPGGGSRRAGSHGGHGLRPPRAGYPQRRYARISGGQSGRSGGAGREHRRPAGVEHPHAVRAPGPVRRDGRRRGQAGTGFFCCTLL